MTIEKLKEDVKSLAQEVDRSAFQAELLVSGASDTVDMEGLEQAGETLREIADALRDYAEELKTEEDDE